MRYKLYSNSQLHKALEAINASKNKIAVIVDDESNVIGTLTDGDIRRGLLAGLGLDDEVSKFMNARPTLVSEGDDLAPYYKDLKHNLYRHIVIINSAGKLSRVLTLDDFDDQGVSTKGGKVAVIMAGGRGKRLGPITDDMPKPMVPVTGKPMIEHVINRLRLHGYTKLYISVHYKKEHIIDYLKTGAELGVEIHYLEEMKPLGTAGSLSLLPRGLDHDFLVVNSDLITNIDYFSFEKQHHTLHKTATVCVRQHDIEVPFGVLEIDENMSITRITEKPQYSHTISTGIYLFKPSILNYLSYNEYLDMPDLLNVLIEKKSVAAYSCYEIWHDIGRIEDLERIRTKYSESKFNDVKV